MKEGDYRYFLKLVHDQDGVLVEISQKFSDLTKEAKRILDEVKDKSEARKEKHGVNDDLDEKPKYHHRQLPHSLMNKLKESAKEVENLHKVFTKYATRTADAIKNLHASKNRMSKLRKGSSIVGNKNIFS